MHKFNLKPIVQYSKYIDLYKYSDDAENTTSKSHGPRALLMAPTQQQERT